MPAGPLADGRETIEANAPREPPPSLEPIDADHRVAAIDILRGLALFGIIAANIRGFAGPGAAYFDPRLMWPGFGDRLTQAILETLVQGKFITIFALLFGVGFAVQLSRADERGVSFSARYVRRLTVLAAIGLVHGLFIWWGDILLPYAVTGFALLLFRHRTNRTVLKWAVLGYFWPILLFASLWVAQMIHGEPFSGPAEPTSETLAETVRTYREGTWLAITQVRAREAATLNWAMSLLIAPNLMGLFLFGLLAWRQRVFDPPAVAWPRYRRLLVWGLVIGVVGNAAAVAIRWFVPIKPFPPTSEALAVFTLQQMAVPALSLAYIIAVILLARDDDWRSRLAPFGAVGRTALSNYLLQSILATLLFYSYGLGLYGRYGPTALLAPTVGIYAVGVVVSRWWLARYRFGPAEWVWRSLTYRQRPPFRRRNAAGV
jgi:uncharacterized protein